MGLDTDGLDAAVRATILAEFPSLPDLIDLNEDLPASEGGRLESRPPRSEPKASEAWAPASQGSSSS